MGLANVNIARGFFVYKLQSVLGSSLNPSSAAGHENDYYSNYDYNYDYYYYYYTDKSLVDHSC